MDIEPDLSVCVVARHDRETLCASLGALLACADPLALQVIVVVAAGDAFAGEVSDAFPEVLVYEEAEGVPPVVALNRALGLATGRYLGLLGDTVRCRPDSLRRLVEYLDEEPDVGLAGPRLEAADGTALPSARAFPSLAALLPGGYWRRRYGYADWDRTTSREVEWLADDCLLFRREVWDEIGPLDEAFARGGADLDFCWRARRAGWHLVFRADSLASPASNALAGEALSGWEKVMAGGRFLARKWRGLLA